MTDVGPHDFDPFRFWDDWHKQGRCKGCYFPRWAHPVRCWTNARPIGDKRPAAKRGWNNRIGVRALSPASTGDK